MFALTALMAAFAAPAAASPAPPAAGWQSVRSDAKCVLTLHVGDPAKDTSLAIHRTPGEDEIFVYLINTRWYYSPARHPSRVALSLEPGGSQATTAAWYSAISFDREPGAAFVLQIEDRGFLDRLASAHALVVKEGDRLLASFDLPLADKAVAALRACENDMLRRWNIDPAFWNGLRSGPIPTKPLVSYVSDQDFPSNPRRTSGKSVVKLTVDATGKAVECTVLRSSGNASFESSTCRMFVTRPRFRPAIDGNGNPVPAPYIMMSWLVGGI